MTLTPIFSGNRMMMIAGFGSGSGTNLKALIEEPLRQKAEGNQKYEMGVLVIDKNAAGVRGLSEQYEIPLIYDSFIGFCRQEGLNPSTDEAKEAWYPRIIGALQSYNVDLICLGGFMLWVKEPLLTVYRDRIINVHPADLSILDNKGNRIYIGDKAVYDALKAGENTTKSTIHIVDEKPDGGEILVQSKELSAVDIEDIIGDDELLKEFAREHQDRQKKHCDWPAYTAAVNMIAEGRIEISEQKHEIDTHCRIIYVNGKPMPYSGYQLEG